MSFIGDCSCRLWMLRFCVLWFEFGVWPDWLIWFVFVVDVCLSWLILIFVWVLWIYLGICLYCLCCLGLVPLILVCLFLYCIFIVWMFGFWVCLWGNGGFFVCVSLAFDCFDLRLFSLYWLFGEDWICGYWFWFGFEFCWFVLEGWSCLC